LTITPSVIIRRSRSGKAGFQVIDVSHEENGERALLAFASPEIAETFRSDTGTYPEEDGFIVMPSDVEQLRVVLWGGDFKRAALRGLESPEELSFFDAADFMWLLMESEYDPKKPLG
jgi:hypothetical protein